MNITIANERVESISSQNQRRRQRIRGQYARGPQLSRNLCCLALLLASIDKQHLRAEEDVQIIAAAPMKQNEISGVLSLSADQVRVESGDALGIRILLRWTSSWAMISDPFFSFGTRKHASLRVFSDTGAYIGAVLPKGGSFDSDIPGRFYAHEGVLHGRLFQIATANRTVATNATNVGASNSYFISHLGEGNYRLQFVVFESFLTDSDELEGSKAHMASDVLAASNVVTLQVCPPVGNSHVKNSDGPPWVAKLIVPKSRLLIGEPFEFEVFVEYHGKVSTTVLNPGFREHIGTPTASLCISNVKISKSYGLYNLGFNGSGPLQKPMSAHWLTVPPGAILGVKKTDARVSIMNDGLEQLKAGRYLLQALFNDRFESSNPFGDIATRNDPRIQLRWETWLQKHSGKKHFQSNTVEVLLVEGARPPKDGRVARAD